MRIAVFLLMPSTELRPSQESAIYSDPPLISIRTSVVFLLANTAGPRFNSNKRTHCTNITECPPAAMLNERVFWIYNVCLIYLYKFWWQQCSPRQIFFASHGPDLIRNLSSLQVNCPFMLSDFNQTWNMLTIFNKSFQYTYFCIFLQYPNFSNFFTISKFQ